MERVFNVDSSGASPEEMLRRRSRSPLPGAVDSKSDPTFG